MSIKIQKPTIGRVVEYVAPDNLMKHVGVIIRVRERDRVDIRDQNTLEMQENVYHDGDGAIGTWRYPPFVKEEVEVDR